MNTSVIVSAVHRRRWMEVWSTGGETLTGKRKHSEKQLSEWHCVHLKPHWCRERDRERPRFLRAAPSSTNPVGRIIMTMESSNTQSTTCPNSTLSISNPIVKMLLLWEKRSTPRNACSNATLPQTAYGPAQDRTWASVVKGWQLTA